MLTRRGNLPVVYVHQKKLMGFINYTPGWDVWGNEV